MNFIGMDIHKQFTVAVVKDEQGNELAKDKFENSKERFADFLKQFPTENTKIVMESTCVWEYIFEILEEMKYDVKLSNPSRTKAIAWARIKTDNVDASTLADLLRANLVAESYIPPKHIRQLREIVRERRTFVKQTTQIKNRIHALLIKRGIKLPTATLSKKALKLISNSVDENDILEHYINLLWYHKQELNFIEDKIRKISEENPEAKLLITIPGIAEIRGMDIIAEIGDINRFPTADKLCSYAGLVPSIKQSGNSLRFGRLIQQSSKVLKYNLIEASWNIVRTKEDNPLKRFYIKLSKKKGKQKAICATARKLCCVIHSMLRKNQKFMIL
ncbi:IS110 family transposase [Candidatus Pacearchaeota archaeon]|nr:IS110 family transposase [Candidatus Pacearchaeota archaeon]